MRIEIINTGTELLLGSTLNTHQQWLCRQLAARGLTVARQVTVADTGPAIEQAVVESLGRSDLLITTGGLGPTSDDLTRERIAAVLHLELREDPAVVEHIRAFFAARNRPMPERTRLQAQIPQAAVVLPNRFGTAPGLALRVPPGRFRPAAGDAWLIMLPGPPRELHPMFMEQVVPLLERAFPTREPCECRVLRTAGLGESLVEDRIGEPLASLVAEGLEIGYCAHVGSVDVRLSACGAKAALLVQSAENIVRPLLGRHVFADGDESLESVVVRLLTERRQTVSLAESCTGGLIAHRLTNVPGASAVLQAGLVTYSNAAKQSWLGVRAETLDIHGAVSEPTARAMAAGVRARTGSDYGLAVTGIAGPSGGSPEKPVGTVYLAVAHSTGVHVTRQLNPYDRETFKFATSQQALDLLRQTALTERA